MDLWSKLIRPALEVELSEEFNELWVASVGCGAACAAALCEITRKKVGGSGGVIVAHDSLTHHSARAPQTHKCQPPNMNDAHGALI